MIRRLIRFTAAALLLLLAVAAWRIVNAPGPAPVLPPLTEKIDLIEIDKSDRRMTVFRDGVALRSYDIALGFSPAGDKAQEGDGRTPEGRFRIDRRNHNSKFHLSLGLDYPHKEDIDHAVAYGFSPGGDIFIHGQPNWFPGQLMRGDWTEGCIAVSNAEMEEIWRVANLGTEVVIRP
ncbi:MAG: L,D-transpeptidase family protein [Pseudomonadota bacterium]